MCDCKGKLKRYFVAAVLNVRHKDIRQKVSGHIDNRQKYSGKKDIVLLLTTCTLELHIICSIVCLAIAIDQ